VLFAPITRVWTSSPNIHDMQRTACADPPSMIPSHLDLYIPQLSTMRNIATEVLILCQCARYMEGNRDALQLDA
jgi:hypothetical protein